MRHAFLFFATLGIAIVPGAASGRVQATLHEPIPADPSDDVALGVGVAGDMPAVIDTPSGQVHAPDPRRPNLPTDKAYGPNSDVPSATYMADRDTRRPNTLPYDDPFNPSTAPFKRLVAFDAVDASFRLYVKDPALVVVSAESPQPGDDRFFGDMRVELASDRHVRIPSVGPGTRLLHASAKVGATDIAVKIVRDGADNWFVDLPSHAPVQARLVLDLGIPRSTFGGDFADMDWGQLRSAGGVPSNVADSAEKVNKHIGVDRTQMRPRDVIRKMVGYYRSFVDSDDPPRPSADVYSDLAMSQKGVCRHRAFAFVISSIAIGIPTRMVMNEAHAWVEVHDGQLWKRIDLGGAGRALSADLNRAEVPYESPPDPFRWPTNAQSGDDLAERTRNGGGGGGNGGNNGGGSANNPTPSMTTPMPTVRPPNDHRPASKMTLTTSVKEAVRGEAVRVSGDVVSDGETCGGIRVDIVLTAGRGELVVGSLATDDTGHYERSIVLPASLALGNYEVHARTSGDTRCGPGESH